MNKFILAILTILVTLSGCEDMFVPAIENNVDLEAAYNNANYAGNLLINGYTRIPTNSNVITDVATDNAVTNDYENDYLEIATGEWTSNNNPFSQWQNSRAAIQYINLFLSINDGVNYAVDAEANHMFQIRQKGEAYGLRALYMYHLLQAHAGWTNGGDLLGIPIVLEPEDGGSEFNLPRATFDECMNQIYTDLDSALALLPLDYEDIANDDQVPGKYTGINKDIYNRVFGESFRLRMNGRIAMAIKAQVALLAASPSYAEGNSTTWEDAANYAADVLDLIGGIGGMDPKGVTWFSNVDELDVMASGISPAEILWRGNVSESNDLERDNYPPTLYGSGRVNPTQNFVDAFCMANGYPIQKGESGYNSSDPYSNRDPRLTHFVLVNGGTTGANETVVYTSADSETDDGLNKIETSTRTGYYLRKLLRQDISMTSTSATTKNHYNPRIRFTEIFLIYAEAANEAWGPTGNGSNSYSAYDVIKAIRNRAGVGVSNGDAYLESIKNNKDAMRELIRNERRIELSFENFRFWDLRRWEANLTNEAKGISITNGNNYEIITVEKRVFEQYMNHGPIPYSEILKFDALEQNEGW